MMKSKTCYDLALWYIEIKFHTSTNRQTRLSPLARFKQTAAFHESFLNNSAVFKAAQTPFRSSLFGRENNIVQASFKVSYFKTFQYHDALRVKCKRRKGAINSDVATDISSTAQWETGLDKTNISTQQEQIVHVQ